MRYLIILFLFPITYYGQVAIGRPVETINSNVILDLTNLENRGLLLNKTNPAPRDPVGNIFFDVNKNMIGVVDSISGGLNVVNYLSPWRHTDASSDVTFTTDIGKVIITNTNNITDGRVVLEVQDGSINVNNGKIKEKGYDLVPAGCIMMWGGTTSPPDGWLLCDGTLKSKTSYPELFAAIGVTYGGSVTSFNLPNFNDKFPKGSSLQNANTTGGQKEFAITKANLPPISHTHSIDHHHSIDHGHDSSETSEAGNHSHNFSIRKRSGTVDPNYTVFWAESNGSKSFTTGSNGEHKHRTYTPDHSMEIPVVQVMEIPVQVLLLLLLLINLLQLIINPRIFIKFHT